MTALVIGGAASGKSQFAEALASSCPAPHRYIATLMPTGSEDGARITRHREMRRSKGFTTTEHYVSLECLHLPERGTVLLECLGNLTANEIFADEGAGESAYNAIADGISALAQQCDNLIVVTNDVFADGASYSGEMQFYLQVLGGINSMLAETFDRVYEVVCGIPLRMR